MPEQEHATCEYCRHTEPCYVQTGETVDQEGNIVYETSHICKDCLGELYS